MPQAPTHPDQNQGTRQPSEIETIVRKVGLLHLLGGLLGLFGPAVKGNDDRGLINTEPGLFLGVVAVNGPHALLHVLFGAIGLRASRNADTARRYLRVSSVFFGVFAAIGWQRFGFERGVHRIGIFAVDGWGNLGHTLLSVFGFAISTGK